jgi:urease accessory protein UreF
MLTAVDAVGFTLRALRLTQCDVGHLELHVRHEIARDGPVASRNAKIDASTLCPRASMYAMRDAGRTSRWAGTD